MTGFLDLPKPVQECIFQLHLVQDEPFDVDALAKICGVSYQEHYYKAASAYGREGCDRIMPCLMQISPPFERLGSTLFYGENTFEFAKHREVLWFSQETWPRHRKIVRKVLCTWDEQSSGGVIRGIFERLARLERLEELSVRLDEQAWFESTIGGPGPGKWHQSLGLGPQLQLQVLNC